MDNVEQSILRAKKTLNESDNNENYLSIKIKPINGGCCCINCWPQTWFKIQQDLYEFGMLEHGGDLAIGVIGKRFILQDHEHGPEIIVPIVIASANLIVDITGLILSIIQYRQKERPASQFRIIKRKLKKSQIIEETIIEINSAISSKDADILVKSLSNSLLVKTNKKK